MSDSGLKLIVERLLLRSHRDKQILIRTGRQLQCDVRLAPTYKAIRQAFTDIVQILVTHHFTGIILHSSHLNEFVIWSETILVNELHYRVKFLQFILQRGTRKHNSIIRLNPPYGSGYLRIPVLDALHLIHHKAFRPDIQRVLNIIADSMIRDYLVERL